MFRQHLFHLAALGRLALLFRLVLQVAPVSQLAPEDLFHLAYQVDLLVQLHQLILVLLFPLVGQGVLVTQEGLLALNDRYVPYHLLARHCPTSGLVRSIPRFNLFLLINLPVVHLVLAHLPILEYLLVPAVQSVPFLRENLALLASLGFLVNLVDLVHRVLRLFRGIQDYQELLVNPTDANYSIAILDKKL